MVDETPEYYAFPRLDVEVDVIPAPRFELNEFPVPCIEEHAGPILHDCSPVWVLSEYSSEVLRGVTFGDFSVELEYDAIRMYAVRLIDHGNVIVEVPSWCVAPR